MSKLEIPAEQNYLKGLRWEPAMLIDYQSVSLEDVLPGLFYVVRVGRRRGKGYWGNRSARDAAVELSQDAQKFDGFRGDRETRVLGEWLKASILRLNERRGSEKVMSIRPLHLMTYRVDLPVEWTHLRSVPEFVAAILHQDPIEGPGHPSDREPFALQQPENLFWKNFGAGLVNSSQRGVADQDRLDEAYPLDIDALLAVRIGARLTTPPEIARGGRSGAIPGFEPLCPRQAHVFRDDFSLFLRGYPPSVIPVRVLGDYVLCLLALNLTIYTLSHFWISNHLYDTGEWVDDSKTEDGGTTRGLDIYVDLTGGRIRHSRNLARQSYLRHYQWTMRQIRSMVGFRLLNHYLRARTDIRELRNLRDMKGLEFLRTLALGRQSSSPEIYGAAQAGAAGDLSKLESLRPGGDWPEDIAVMFRDHSLAPFDRLVELLSVTQDSMRGNILDFIRSCTRRNLDSGLLAGTPAKREQDNYYTLGIQMLETLVQLAILRPNGTATSRPIDVYEFVNRLKSRYGIWIDEPPPGLDQSYEARQAARANFESLKEQLRQLGFFRAVTDAHRMQRLIPRYRPIGDLVLQEGAENDE